MSENEVGRVGFAVSGASGAVGGRVATPLASLGHGQRLIVRNIDRAPDLPGAGVAQASYDDPEAMRRALDSVETFCETVDKGFLARWNDKLKEHDWLANAVAGC